MKILRRQHSVHPQISDYFQEEIFNSTKVSLNSIPIERLLRWSSATVIWLIGVIGVKFHMFH
uniref:Uncharacterized protein n=1 Tax=Rhizophagus irregularis (strain DAOM 181602 / DAOM 197198 / MUCL 43194) TaxID=747089 RepID=U9TGZ3_RHIID